MSYSALFFVCFLFIDCKTRNQGTGDDANKPDVDQTGFQTIKAIPLPEGYERISLAKDSFGEWLRAISLKKDGRVYLYDGSLKRDQSAQFAVLEIPVGKKDLQQCADAVIRLRAEYLFAKGRYSAIVFRDNNATPYDWKGKDNKQGFEKYLETVFGMCGTASLEKQLELVNERNGMQPGDVFVKGGFPGHAMIVVDVAINKMGNKVFMLAQGFMPAQDIHIVKNPLDEELSPWFDERATDNIVTPGWVFRHSQLRRW